ncbi:hypothetical protein ACLOJK_034750 [Asimina triloba]
MIFSAQPEHQIRCSIILLKPAAMLPAMGFPAKPPSINRSRPSRHPHVDPSIQPIRISFVFFNGQQWWTTSCSSSIADAPTTGIHQYRPHHVRLHQHHDSVIKRPKSKSCST